MARLGQKLSPESRASFAAKLFARAIERTFWPNVIIDSGCWNWAGKITVKGYGRCSAGRQLTAHRVSWIIHNGPIPNDLWVLHHCDNRLCVRPDHLYLGNATDNINDAYRRNRRTSTLIGVRPPLTKLRDEDIPVIRDLHASGLKNTEIARRYNVHPGTIGKIILGQSWHGR